MTVQVTASEFKLSLRYQRETSKGSGRYHQLSKRARWNAKETAVIVCDVWDLHHSLNAVRRVGELGPRLNQLLKQARKQGATIIHSPSDCMDAYRGHPARVRAQKAPKSANLPDDIRSWCSVIPSEEAAVYPLDQADGGDDDDPSEHAEWAAKLKKMGRKVGNPWKMQSKLITIDGKRDYISDRGDEVWNILESRGIKNVILTGVHTNMCVLGRPFGLRQMVRNGKRVVLVRDMTDTMYNPKRWPYVSHFTGTDLIISHIERFVCPTVTSDQILGGSEFRFKHDRRPHLVIVMAEREYETNKTLPKFALHYLGKQFRVTLVHADPKRRNQIPGIEAVKTADILLISIRRRALAPSKLKLVRDFVKAGKPVVGIRTASHAFSLRGKPAPSGHTVWESWDGDVFGGHYTNHHGNKLKSTVRVVSSASRHAILRGIDQESFPQAGSLYMTRPLAKGTKVLLSGTVKGKAAEPVAWTYKRSDGGRSFYTSLGHPGDFDNPQFLRLLANGICWAGKLSTTDVAIVSSQDRYRKHWSLMPVPSTWQSAGLSKFSGPAWYRCSLRLRKKWAADSGIFVELPKGVRAWFNGQPLKLSEGRYQIPEKKIEWNDANLLVVRLPKGSGDRGWTKAPVLRSGKRQLQLKGRWQFRIGDKSKWSNIPLPARYGTSTDIVFEPK